MSRIITLTTDFGDTDHFSGIMKGVILGIEPKATLVDLTHKIEPQNILQGALMLASALPFFPPRTIHLVVVDPGVGTARRPIVVKTHDALLVGPDNGVLTAAFSGKVEAYELTNTKYFLPTRSSTFHGRDLFAPVAAHLAAGVKPEKMGRKINNPVVLKLPRPKMDGPVLKGEVVYADRFGNLSTNITAQDIKRHLPGPPVMKLGRRTLKQFVRTYGECEKGKPGFLINSWNAVEIFVHGDSAQQMFKLKPGSPVSLRAS